MQIHSLLRVRMHQSLLGRFLVAVYPHLPLRRFWLHVATRVEGGSMYSVTLRAVLDRYFGVKVGHYSYGSLLQPGQADRNTAIGDYVSIGPGVRRFGAAHPVTRPSMHPFWYNPALGLATVEDDVDRTECLIESESWIGASVLILPGCRRIGVRAVIGAGSVVTKDVEDFAIVVGNPARQIGTRLIAAQREKLLEAKPWKTSNLLEYKSLLDEIETESD